MIIILLHAGPAKIHVTSRTIHVLAAMILLDVDSTAWARPHISTEKVHNESKLIIRLTASPWMVMFLTTHANFRLTVFAGRHS